MSIASPTSHLVDARKAAADTGYDAIIVGSGVSGAIIAKELSKAGKRVLIVEAGVGADREAATYEHYMLNFYNAASKDNQAPYPINRNADMPRGPDLRKLQPGETDASSYIVQAGPYVSDTVFTRVFGGTTMHWEAKTPRMLPSDFQTRSMYDQGVDWPIGYDELEPDYEQAEREIGVSADVEDQTYLDLNFAKDYVYPMKGLPLSYLDQMVAKGIDGSKVELHGEEYPISVRPFPQGRNGIPNSAYDGGKGFVPTGAVHNHLIEEGGRCQGNTNCVPICPVQARYHAGKTIAKALHSGRVDLLAQAVGSRVVVDPDSGRVTGIEVKVYKDKEAGDYETFTLKGKIFVLASNAIETPRLMLASGLRSTSGLMGRNFMDHAYLLNWALLPETGGTMRGTTCTGGIVDLRGGPFRRHQAAFAVDIHNDGWGWATGSPYSDIDELVDQHNLFGADLRRGVIDRLSRQLLLAFMIEVMPSESNRVNIDPGYTDRLGNMRPIVSFAMPEYTMRGAQAARQFAKTVFARLGAHDHTRYDPADFGYLTYEGEGYAIRGGNHLAGTHVMGNSKYTSVVDTNQRSWDHENLYLVGGGSMPSIGTSNVTLTLAALCFRSSRAMIKALGQ